MKERTYTLIIVTLLIFSPANIYAQWLWSNPKPQGNSLRAVKFINNNVGWAVGIYRTIIKTTDGGVNWVQQNIGNDNEGFEAVDAADPEFAIAVGWGIIKVTTNGGKDWIKKSPALGTYFRSVVVFNRHKAIVAGDKGVILTSTDGGNNWNINSLNSSVGTGNLAFADSLNGVIAAGSVLYRTTDGGTNWFASNSNIPLMQLAFPDVNALYAASYYTDWLNTKFYKIVKSTDSGVTWSEVLGLGQWHEPWDIKFYTSNYGCVSMGNSDAPAISFTEDGGASWRSVNTGNIFRSLSFLNETNLVAISDYYQGRIIKTTDKGLTWFDLSSGFHEHLSEVKYLNNCIIAVGGGLTYSGNIYRSSDNGLSWSNQYTITNKYLRGLSFWDEQNGLAVGTSSAIVKTTNGGISWFPCPLNLPQYDLYGIYCFDQNRAVAVGQLTLNQITTGAILQTSDGGITWVKYINFLTNEPLMDVFFINNNLGFAVGPDIIVKTTNGGTTWSIINYSGWINSVCFTSDNVGYIISNKTILKTTDGGNTWGVTGSFTSNLSSLFFFDADNGIAVGDESVILITSDAGSRWQKQISPTGYHLNSIHFKNRNEGVIVGEWGTVLTTTNGGSTFVNDKENQVLNSFMLQQNYPNPFNPETRIRYNVPLASEVSIILYDILGCEVKKLLSEYKSPGEYELTLDASSLAGGVYFYRMRCGMFNEVKKMVLMK